MAKQILITDDSKLMRRIIKGMVDEVPFLEDCEFYEAEDGEKADEILSNNKIDILFLDWNMPKVNGIEIAKKVHSNHYENSHPVVIMVTSEAAKYNIIEALENGVNHYLIKPVVKSEIIEVLKKIDI